jgi:hypothetical protein
MGRFNVTMYHGWDSAKILVCEVHVKTYVFRLGCFGLLRPKIFPERNSF